MLAQTSTRLRVDAELEELGIDLPHRHRGRGDRGIAVDARSERVRLAPRACELRRPVPLSVVYPAPFVRREAKPRLPDAELLRLLRALGDDTRFGRCA